MTSSEKHKERIFLPSKVNYVKYYWEEYSEKCAVSEKLFNYLSNLKNEKLHKILPD